MLRELNIRNLAVIEQVNVAFHPGFHVLTGETGAGKSIVIDALALAAGGRGSAEMIRHGCSRADVEAVFELPVSHPVWGTLHKLGIESSTEDSLLVRRELSAQGKSSARVNGQSVTLTMLREIGEHLVNIHGQHEHQSLLRIDRHLEWLDSFAGEEVAGVKADYRGIYQQYLAVSRERRELEDKSRQGMQMLDLYRFQIKEIEGAKLKAGEDESLEEERRKLAHAEKLTDAATEAYDSLYGSKGLSAISRALTRLQDIVKVDPAILEPMVEQLQTAYYNVEDAAFQLRGYKEQIEFNPQRLTQIELRLDLLHGLKRKYGESAADILTYLKRVKEEAEQLDNRDELLNELAEKEASLHAELRTRAEQLSVIRRSVSRKLAKQVERELAELQMERSIFEVRLNAVGVGPTGSDAAEFMLSTNPGEPPKPLSKIASGGEMSRVMLALKAIFARIDEIPVLIFDEVDTGVSGRAAQAVAEKLSLLAGHCQVFAITHLPQVACMADYQYEIFKQVTGEDRTQTRVTELSAEQRIEELARMLGGVEVTEKTRHHATEMLALADQRKNA